MTTSPIELGSVHLTKNGLQELESCLRSLSEPPKIEIQVKSNGFVISESTVDEILNHDLSKSESLAYDIRLTCDEGKLRIVADSKFGDEHLLYLDGEYEWMNKVEYRITSLMEARENRCRSFINSRKAIGVEVFAAIGLSSSLGLFLPSKILHPIISWADYFVLLISAIALFAAIQRNRVYPYFRSRLTKTPDIPTYSLSYFQ